MRKLRAQTEAKSTATTFEKGANRSLLVTIEPDRIYLRAQGLQGKHVLMLGAAYLHAAGTAAGFDAGPRKVRRGQQSANPALIRAIESDRARAIEPASPAQPVQRGVCQLCGCTDAKACPGGCAWVDPAHTVCSVCAVKYGQRLMSLASLQPI